MKQKTREVNKYMGSFFSVLILGVVILFLPDWVFFIVVGLILGYWLDQWQRLRDIPDPDCGNGIHLFENSSVCKCGGLDKEGNKYVIPTVGWRNPKQ